MRLRPILWVTAAGLLAAIFCSCFMPLTIYTAGAWFGVAAAICLKELNIFENKRAILLRRRVNYCVRACYWCRCLRLSSAHVQSERSPRAIDRACRRWRARRVRID